MSGFVLECVQSDLAFLADRCAETVALNDLSEGPKTCHPVHARHLIIRSQCMILTEIRRLSIGELRGIFTSFKGKRCSLRA